MATSVYQPKDNGDLKLLAEIEENVDEGEAVELLLENAPRLKNTEAFVVIVGDLDDGVVSTVSQKETVTIKWSSSRRNGGDDEEQEEQEVPAPKSAPKPRRGRPPGSGRKPAAKGTTSARKPAASKGGSGRKPAAKGKAAAAKPRGRKPAAKKSGGSPFKRNPNSDE